MAIGTLQYNTEHAHCVSYEYLMKVGIQHDVNSQNWLMFLPTSSPPTSAVLCSIGSTIGFHIHGEGPY